MTLSKDYEYMFLTSQRNDSSWPSDVINNETRMTSWMDDADYLSLREAMMTSFRDNLLTISSPFTIILVILYSFSFVIGVVGNFLVIIVVARDKHMRNITNTFLVNLAIGDMLVMLLCLPFTLSALVYRQWIYGDSMCRLNPFVQCVSVSVSIMTLLVISLNRFYAIHKPLKARLIFSRSKVAMMLAIIWISSAALASPMAIINNVEVMDIQGLFTSLSCEERWPSLRAKQIYNIILFLFLYAQPLVCITVAYCRIGSALWYNDGQVSRGHEDIRENAQSRALLACRRRVVRMLMFLVAIFAISWLPYHIVYLYLDFFGSGNDNRELSLYGFPLVQWLALSNSSFNPVCYCLLSKSFRESFKKVYKRCMACRRTQKAEHTMSLDYETSERYNRREPPTSSSFCHDGIRVSSPSWRSFSTRMKFLVRQPSHLPMTKDARENGKFVVNESAV